MDLSTAAGPSMQAWVTGAAIASTRRGPLGVCGRASCSCTTGRTSLFASSQRKDQVKNGASLNLVVSRRLLVVHLLSREDESLLRRRDPFLLLNSLLDPLDLVSGLDVDLDLLASQRLHLDPLICPILMDWPFTS